MRRPEPSTVFLAAAVVVGSWAIVKLALNADTNPVHGPVLLRLVDPISPNPTHWQGTLLINGDSLEVVVIAKNPNRRTEP